MSEFERMRDRLAEVSSEACLSRENYDYLVELHAFLSSLTRETRTRNAYDEPVNEISWSTPWKPVRPCEHPPPPPGDFECCASGRCEVCAPGFTWGCRG